MNAEDEELTILRALDLPRTLSEVVRRTGIPERRCRSTLYRLKKRGLLDLQGHVWRKTPDGKRYQKELEESRSSDLATRKGAASKSMRQRYESYLKQEELLEMTSSVKTRAEDVVEDLKVGIAACQSIPLARRDQRNLERLQRRILWLVDRLAEVKDGRELKEVHDLLRPLMNEVNHLLPQVEARLHELGLFQYLQQDDQKYLIEFKCTACGCVQTHTRFGERGEAVIFKCENASCGLKGRVFGRPASE